MKHALIGFVAGLLCAAVMWANSSNVAAKDAVQIASRPAPEVAATRAACAGDLNGDHVVDVLDMLILFANWGPCPGCQSANDCDDGDPCTMDFCQAGVCMHLPSPDCCINDCDCGPGEACVEGQCSCPLGTTDCNGECVDLSSNDQHCGGCNVQCPSGTSCIDTFCTPLQTWYVDMDEDGWGDCADFIVAANPIFPYTAAICGDCNDSDPNTHPGAPEICNDGIDNNCDGVWDCNDPACCSDLACGSIFYRDLDQDGWGVCGDFIISCGPQGIYTATICGDCDDTNPAIHPGADEICNGIDDNCDGQVDEGNPCPPGFICTGAGCIPE